jgi:potassium channel subfamily K
MRKVQQAAERERRWFALAMSSSFALILWLVGAVVFKECEYRNHWTYLESLYFAYTSLLTIGYGDFSPESNSGKAFFVFWSLLAVPSLTILISNMGDTIIKAFSDITIWIGSVTVLPDEGGLRASLRTGIEEFSKWCRDSLKTFSPPGIFGAAPIEHEKRIPRSEYDNRMLDRLAERLGTHVHDDDVPYTQQPDQSTDHLSKDIQFYNYVLARECRNLQKDLSASPAKQYSWGDWEYYLKLMGNEDDPVDFPGQQEPDILVPEPMRAPKNLASEGGGATNRPDSEGSGVVSGSDEKDLSSTEAPAKNQMDGNVERKTSVAQHNDARRKLSRKRRLKNPEDDSLVNWSWLSNESPLMGQKSEAEWILERLSAALERELNRQQKGYRRKPPISLKDARRQSGGVDTAGGAARDREQRGLAKAANNEE